MERYRIGHQPVARPKRSLTWTRDEGQNVGTVPPRFYNPKTKAGYRELPLPAELVFDAAHVEAGRASRAMKIFVFGHPTDGGPLETIVHRPQGTLAGLPRARACVDVPLGVFQSNSFASRICLSRGVAIPTVAALMGHSSPAITMRVYAHHVKGSDTGAAVAQFASGFLTLRRQCAERDA